MTGAVNNPLSAPDELASPTQRAIIDLHRNDDLDAIPESHHHSLGTTRVNASPGNHIHDGVTSIALLNNVVFTGSRSTGVATILNQIMDALVPLGATNSTSA